MSKGGDIIANEENLITGNKNHTLTPEEAQRGGLNSAKARREKSALKKAVQDMLNSSFKDKDGKEKTGLEIAILGIVKNIADPKSKNWGKAMDLISTMTDSNMNEYQIDKLISETELNKAKTNEIEQTDYGTAEIEDDPLTKSLKELAEELNDK